MTRLANSRAAYYALRTRFNALLERGDEATSEAAGIFYYLNRTGYNGLCRFDHSGAFNVPFGRYATISYRSDFSDYAAAFANWEFTTGSFENIALQPADFVYADPPYDVEFTHYSKGGFSWNDQVGTAEWLAQHAGPVILSNQATPRILKLYRDLDFELIKLSAPRRISSTWRPLDCPP